MVYCIKRNVAVQQSETLLEQQQEQQQFVRSHLSVNLPMAGIILTVFKSAVASRMFSGISSALKATRMTSVLSEPQRKYMFRFSLKLHSHIDY